MHCPLKLELVSVAWITVHRRVQSCAGHLACWGRVQFFQCPWRQLSGSDTSMAFCRGPGSGFLGPGS